MNLNPKQIILSVSLFGLVSCGETPTSQLSEQFPVIRSGPHNMNFAFIPRGHFRMGSPKDEKDREDDERQYWVKLTEDYWMQTTEVTVAQWHKVMGSFPDNKCWKRHYEKKETDYPMLCVNWYEVKGFVDRLNTQERNSGYKYSLPTEAQWEYAARGYTETPYSIDGSLKSFAWYSSSSDDQTHLVGNLKANFFGLYDVHGNVYEWVSDWYEEDYPKAESYSDAVINPKGPNNGSERILRGGSWFNPAQYCRSAVRYRDSASIREDNNGFRLMRIKI